MHCHFMNNAKTQKKTLFFPAGVREDATIVMLFVMNEAFGSYIFILSIFAQKNVQSKYSDY